MKRKWLVYWLDNAFGIANGLEHYHVMDMAILSKNKNFVRHEKIAFDTLFVLVGGREGGKLKSLPQAIHSFIEWLNHILNLYHSGTLYQSWLCYFHYLLAACCTGSDKLHYCAVFGHNVRSIDKNNEKIMFDILYRLCYKLCRCASYGSICVMAYSSIDGLTFFLLHLIPPHIRS